MQHWLTGEICIGEDLEGIGCGLIAVVLGIYLEGLTKNRKTSVRVGGVLTVTRTEDPPNTSPNCYRYSNLHGF
jgi:hypothetical protein